MLKIEKARGKITSQILWEELTWIQILFLLSLAIECVDMPEFESICPKWAKNGQCTTNTGFMKIFCKKSCDMCASKISNWYNF